MASRTCSLKGCNNPLSANSPHEFCFRHRDMSSSAVAVETESLRETAPELFLTRGISMSSVTMHSNHLVDATPVHGSYSPAIAQACKSWNDSLVASGTIPAMGARLDNAEALNAFKEELIKAGISQDRISVYRFSEGTRRNPRDGKLQEFGPETHDALVLDARTQREVVIDPSVSKYAPVNDWEAEVDDQLPSGMTPFGDSPWIGSMDDYTNGGFLRWNEYRQIG